MHSLTPRIRKPAYELTVQDLETYPVWEFAMDEEGEEGQDESTVRPCVVSGPIDPDDGQYLVRANFKLANGARMKGWISTPYDREFDLGDVQPVVVTPAGQVSFWCSVIERKASDIAADYKCLGAATAHEVFPMQFESDVELVGGPISGEIPGFVVFVEVGSMHTRVVR
jgi:hypothetical protein